MTNLKLSGISEISVVAEKKLCPNVLKILLKIETWKLLNEVVVLMY